MLKRPHPIGAPLRLSMIRVLLSATLLIGLISGAHADAISLLRAGLAARSQGNFEAAIHFYTQAIETGELPQAQLAIVLNSRGVAYDIKGNPDKAIADFTAAIQINAHYADAY